MADILTADDIAKLETQEVDNPTPMARKAALDSNDIDYISSVERAIKETDMTESEKGIKTFSEMGYLSPDEVLIHDLPRNDNYEFEKKLHDLMLKGTRSFTENVAEAFNNGNESSTLDIAAYDSMARPGSYESEVKPLRIDYQKRLAEDPVNGRNFLSKAVYSVAGMVPAMGKGEIEGIKMAAAGASAASIVPGPLKLPAVGAAAAAGKMAGSINYWYKQGAGSLYADLKDQDIEDTIAVPVAHIAGAIYGAIEFAQVDKLIPGSKEVTKRAILQTTKKAIAKLVVKYGATLSQEVTEEGWQEVTMSIAKDTATNIAKKTNKNIGDIWMTAMNKGWNAIKEAGVPMALMLTPKATIDTANTARSIRSVEQAKKFLQTPQEGVGIRFSRPDQSLQMYMVFEGKATPVTGPQDAKQKWLSVVFAAMKQGVTSRDLGSNPVIQRADGRVLGIMTWNGSFIYKPSQGKAIESSQIQQIEDKTAALTAEARKHKTFKSFERVIMTVKEGEGYGYLEPLVKEISISEFGDKIAKEQEVDTAGVEEWKKRIEAGERPIVLWGGEGFTKVVDGHHRLEAYKQLGFKSIPAVWTGAIKEVYEKANSDIRFSRTDQTKTPAFKKWFGDSKIVDGSGNPLVVYHGSAESGIGVFDASKAGSIQKSDWGKGVYFTPNKYMAKGYRDTAVNQTDKTARNAWDEFGRVAKEYGTDVMMMWMDYQSKKITEAQYDSLREYENKWREALRASEQGDAGEVYAVYLKMENPLNYTYGGITEDLEGVAKAGGHDGIIVRNEDGDIDEIIVFKPNQIKSATDNNGQFDPLNDNIRFSKQGKGGNLTAEEIRDRVVRLTDGMSNRPDFIVVQSHKDAEQYAGGEVPSDAEAFFVRLNDQDTIVFIADGLRQDRLDFVLYHELVGHYGMKAIMGPKMAMTLQTIYDNSPEIRSAADEIMTSFPEYSFVRAVEEALADKAGEVVKGRTEPSWWAKPRKIIRDAVRAFVKQDLTIDDMDIAVIIADSKRLVEGQEFMVEGEAVPIGADQEEAIGADIEEEMQQEINNLLAEDIVDQEVQEVQQLGKISETDSNLMRDIMRIEEIENDITQHEQRLETMKQLPKIRPYNKGDLKEELADIPKYFMSEEGMPLDYVVMNTDDLTYFPKGTTESDVIEFYRQSYVSPEERREIAKLRKEQKRLIAETKLKNPVIKAAVERIQKKNIGPIRVSEAAIIKRLYQERFKGERAGFKAGKEEAAQTIKTAKDILDRRRSRIRGIQEQWNLSDADLKKINKRDIRLMSNYEFKLFIDKIEAMAAAYADRREIKNQILFQIQSKELQKTENLMALLKIQSLDKASVEQLNELIQILEDAQKGDVFLSVRKLETVDNTELEGIKTYREARERLAKKIGVPLEKVSNLEVSQLDKFLYDTALARQNPFYKMLVDEANGSLLDGEQRYMDMEREVDELTIKARQSRKRSMFDLFSPTDPLVFEWLESPKERKEELALEMTPEELALASYLQARFAQAREYLIEHQVLKHFQSDYITHIRRGFLETWKEDGILKAFKEIFKQHQEDEAIFKILEGDTQNILPLEKFFQFSMRRSGELTPSKNVSKAFKSYMKAFTKKQSLDKIVPALDIYAHALSPAGVTQRGLQMNRQLIQFTKEWINNKKGRKSSLGGVIPQGGKIDLGLRAVDAFITLIDLGLNIPVGLTVQIGEQITTYVNLGTAQYLKGVQRMNTGKGKAIIKKYQAFVGKSPWEELRNTADGLGEKFHKGIFSLFSIASIRANKIHLLGSMTEAEYESGTISSERQAELKRDIGRFRAVPGAKSILGSTSAGGALTKYKSWALPILSTVVDDLGKLSVMAGNKDFAGAMKSREFRELFRATLMTTVIALTAKGLVDDDDDTFIGILIRKAYRESLSLIGALDPTLLSSVRLLSFLNDLSVAVKQIVTAEKYKSQPGYKGPEKLRRTLMPKFLPKPKKKSKGRLRSGLRSGLR